MAGSPDITLDQCRQLLRYDSDSGKLYWRDRTEDHFPKVSASHRKRVTNSWNAAWAGKEAGSVSQDGYICVTLFARSYRAHRVIWFMHSGQWPKQQIDHIDGVRDNNKISNLREVSPKENQQNMRRSRANTSGVTGVYWCKRDQKWAAEFIVNGRKKHVGRFSDLNDARRAMERARRAAGFNPRHGTTGPAYDEWRSIHERDPSKT